MTLSIKKLAEFFLFLWQISRLNVSEEKPAPVWSLKIDTESDGRVVWIIALQVELLIQKHLVRQLWILCWNGL